MDALPPPPPAEAREACIASASNHYGVPLDAIRLLIRVEGGTTGQVSANTNGTEDLGLMQINSVHLDGAPHRLARYGITRDALINDECLNIHVGTYLLHYELSRTPDFWRAMGNYHSKTPSKNAAYQRRLWTHYQRYTRSPQSLR